MMTKSLSVLAFCCSLVAVSGFLVGADVGGTDVNVGVGEKDCKEWTVILNRFDGSLNFDRNWIEYKNGFGDTANGEYWLGNEIVHLLTTRSAYILRVEVQPMSSDKWYYAEYSTFSLESETNKYTLHLSGYSGNAGDSLINPSLEASGYIGGMKFSTSDTDNDLSSGNCALDFGGTGWWFNTCSLSCLTCRYRENFYWYSDEGWETSNLIRAARMMIRKK